MNLLLKIKKDYNEVNFNSFRKYIDFKIMEQLKDLQNPILENKVLQYMENLIFSELKQKDLMKVNINEVNEKIEYIRILMNQDNFIEETRDVEMKRVYLNILSGLNELSVYVNNKKYKNIQKFFDLMMYSEQGMEQATYELNRMSDTDLKNIIDEVYECMFENKLVYNEDNI